MFVYFKETIFGDAIVSRITRTPFGVSIVFDNSKPMHYDEVEELLTFDERISNQLTFGFLDKELSK